MSGHATRGPWRTRGDRLRRAAWVALLLGGLVTRARAQDDEGDARPGATSRAQIEQGLARYRDEPSVEQVVQGVLAARRADPQRARDAMERARLSGLLPEVRGGARRGQAIDLRALNGASFTDANVYSGDDLMVEGSAVFRLDRLLFSPEEPELLRELRALEEARTELLRLAIALYFERRRLQLERDLLGRRDIAHATRLLETEALLDALSDGAFGRLLARSRR
jgi:hypothetical protein